jgi:voltage-gated potassium channel
LALSLTSIVGIIVFSGGSQLLELIGFVLMLIFCSLSCFIAARNVFVMHKVDPNSLLGAFCVYLLMGLIWAVLYRLLHLYGWATFSGNITAQEQKIFPDLVYFSFVTLASLGYGDISPIGSLPKTLAYLEAILGQFYLAVMVASLVGVYSSKKKPHE